MNYILQDQQEWQIEAIRINKKSRLAMLLLSVFFYCGGMTMGSAIFRPHLLTPVLMSMVWFWVPLTVILMMLDRVIFTGAKTLHYAVFLSCGLSLSLFLSQMGFEDFNYMVFINFAVFITFCIIVLWEWYYVVAGIFALMVIQFLIFGWLSKLPLGVLAEKWLILAPVAAASVWMAGFRYSSVRKNFMMSRALQRSNEQLQIKQSELEKKNNNILDSIRYAKRIQQALLPSIELIEQNLPQSFIYYKPKDIVSGDFFWFARHQYLNFIAVVDCTGHGVPGAFMSLIGFNHLNTIVNEMKIWAPEAVLQQLHHNIYHTLQKDNKSGQRDGMDIIFCAIDEKMHTLSFASAHRPLYLVRNGELTEYKGDKIFIGDRDFQEATFTGQQIDLLPGDRFYLTTDGFADQFGGPEGKKFYTKNLKKLLLNLQNCDICAQGERLRLELEQWQQGHAQVDDITIIGIQPEMN